MKKEKQSWNKREKLMLIVTAVLLVLLVIKTLALDPARPKTADEEMFLSRIQTEMKSEPKDFFHRYMLVSDRIIAIKTLTDTEINELKSQGVLVPTPFKAKVRSYFLFIIPFNEHYRVLTDQERKNP